MDVEPDAGEIHRIDLAREIVEGETDERRRCPAEKRMHGPAERVPV